MPDRIAIATRSEIMRSVKSKNNKSTERKFAGFLKAKRIRGWRRQYQIFGRPDFVFVKERLAIFIDGCFWHGHKCKIRPVHNREYWDKKIRSNMDRDKEVNRYLRNNGWQVLRIWECSLQQATVLARLKRYL